MKIKFKKKKCFKLFEFFETQFKINQSNNIWRWTCKSNWGKSTTFLLTYISHTDMLIKFSDVLLLCLVFVVNCEMNMKWKKKKIYKNYLL